MHIEPLKDRAYEVVIAEDAVVTAHGMHQHCAVEVRLQLDRRTQLGLAFHQRKGSIDLLLSGRYPAKGNIKAQEDAEMLCREEIAC